MSEKRHPRTILSVKGYRWMLTGHPWIYRDDVVSTEDCCDGDIVDIFHQGQFLGKGFYSERSKIRVRVITRSDATVDREYWERIIREAHDYREKVVKDSNAYRLISSEADGIPSLVVDRYGPSFSIQTLSSGTERLKEMFVEILVQLFRPESVYERNDVGVRRLEGLEERKGELYGTTPEHREIQEGSIRLLVDIKGGQKTGAYLDQRENRINAERYFSGRVLDCFCYQGGFSLHAARTAGEVTAVDSSSEALRMAEENARRNSFRNIACEEDNVFDFLKKAHEAGERFDVVVLDPPAFAKSRTDVKNALRAYLEINLRAMRILNPGGFLLTSSCSYHLSEEMFMGLIRNAARQARRPVRIVEKRMQPPDHPILATLPESYYLKSFILHVV